MNFNRSNSNLQKAMIKTIAFFDLFDRPLSAEELRRYCGEECGLDELKCAAQRLKDGILAPQLRLDDKISIFGLSPYPDKKHQSVFGEPETMEPAKLECGLDEAADAAEQTDYIMRLFGNTAESPAGGSAAAGRCLTASQAVKHLTWEFYCLKGREEIIKHKQQADELALRKNKIALRAAKILRFINGVKMIAVCNNFSYSENSDIDLFIIIERGRLWLARFLITAMMHLFRLRRHGENYVKDRICLSFYISDEKMNIKNIALPPCNSGSTAPAAAPETMEPAKAGERRLTASQAVKRLGGNYRFQIPDSKFPSAAESSRTACEAVGPLAPADPYLYYWLALFKPVYGYDCYQEFYKANSWLKNFLPNVEPRGREECDLISDTFAPVFIKKINSWWFEGKIGDLLETAVKKLQLKKMARNLHSVARENDTRVIISDTMLKFHEKDRRAEYRQEWLEKVRKLGVG